MARWPQHLVEDAAEHDEDPEASKNGAQGAGGLSWDFDGFSRCCLSKIWDLIVGVVVEFFRNQRGDGTCHKSWRNEKHLRWFPEIGLPQIIHF